MSKRKGAAGGGSIRKRPDGRWEGRITIGRDPVTGRQKQRSYYGDTQREVRQKLQQAAVELEAGIYVEPSKMTAGKWLELWLAEYKSERKVGTIKVYERTIRRHLVPALGNIPLQRLRAPDIQRMLNGMRANGYSPSTVSSTLTVLSDALQVAVRVGHLRQNPAKLVEHPKQRKREVNPLSQDELTRLLDLLRGGRLYYPVAVYAFCGLRANELIGLSWDRVDYERGLLVIDRQLSQLSGQWEFAPTKSGGGRLVPMPDTVAALLKERRREQVSDRLAAGTAWHEEFPGLVFTSATGSHLRSDTLRRSLQKIAAQIGRPDITIKTLRHTFAVNSLLAGANPKAVQGALGHHSAAFTLDVYAHYTDDMRIDAANRMDEFISSLSKPQRVK